MFTSFLFRPVGNNIVRTLGSWDTAVTVTTAGDIGKLTMCIMFERDIANQVVYTAGLGHTVTYRHLADIVEVWTLLLELVKDPNNTRKKYRVVFGIGKGVSWEIGKTFNAEGHRCRGMGVIVFFSYIINTRTSALFGDGIDKITNGAV
jgi:hypothetical protein